MRYLLLATFVAIAACSGGDIKGELQSLSKDLRAPSLPALPQAAPITDLQYKAFATPDPFHPKAPQSVLSEEQRRDRALRAAYASERDIEAARAEALAENQRAMRATEARIEALRNRRTSYEKELAFYQTADNKSSPPVALLEDMKGAESDLKALQEQLEAQKSEAGAINARYDQQKKRFLQLMHR